MRYSFTNHIAAAASIVGNNEDPNYPAANITTPQAPFRPWKTTLLNDRAVWIDLGSAKLIELIQLIAANFTSARIQSTTVASGGYLNVVQDDMPLGYWRLGDASGTTAVDSAAAPHNGVYNNAPTLGIAGLVVSTATAVDFSSALSQDVSIANVPALGPAGWAMEAVIRPRAIGANMGILARSNAIHLRVQVEGRLRVEWVDSGAVNRGLTANAGTELVAGKVYHVAARHNGTDVTIYLNGVAVGTSAIDTNTIGSGTWRIASIAGSDYFDGVIQEAAVYGPGLTGARIAVHADRAIAPYDELVTVSRNPFNERYQHSYLPAGGLNRRYLRIVIPSQATTDGATAYRLGGIWAGPTVRPPKHFKAEIAFQKREPRVDIGPDHGAWRQRLIIGEPSVAISTTRLAKVNRKSPGLGDELATWLDIDRQARAADVFALFLNAGDPTQGYVMRQLNPVEWSRTERLKRATSPYDLEEVIR